jgi:hypothetical protein
MNGTLFITGIVVGALVVVVATSRPRLGSLDEPQSSILEAIGIVDPKEESPPIDDHAPPSPQYWTLRRAMDIRTPYGKAHLAAGTNLWVVRENETGVVVKIADREMFMPASAFRETAPAPIAVAAPMPPADADKAAE